LQFGKLFGFPLPPVFLATCNALDVPSLILRGVSTVFGIWLLVLRGMCDILEHGRWILHLGKKGKPFMDVGNETAYITGRSMVDM
jgi:hypothetical protein